MAPGATAGASSNDVNHHHHDDDDDDCRQHHHHHPFHGTSFTHQELDALRSLLFEWTHKVGNHKIGSWGWTDSHSHCSLS